MKERYFILLLVFFVCCNFDFTISLKNKNRPCDQEGPCLCVFPNGSGIDIRRLENYKFPWVEVNKTFQIQFNPCSNAVVLENVTLNECNGVSVCLYDLANRKLISLGKAEEGKFSENIEEPFSIQFSKTNTTVKLICDKSKTTPSLQSSVDKDHYILELTSSESCLREISEDLSGLSTGSVLILVFLVLSLVYFGGGLLTLKFLRGAEGKEMIPNYDFWADLPYLVRDGILFTLSGFQSSPSYDRI